MIDLQFNLSALRTGRKFVQVNLATNTLCIKIMVKRKIHSDSICFSIKSDGAGISAISKKIAGLVEEIDLAELRQQLPYSNSKT